MATTKLIGMIVALGVLGMAMADGPGKVKLEGGAARLSGTRAHADVSDQGAGLRARAAHAAGAAAAGAGGSCQDKIEVDETAANLRRTLQYKLAKFPVQR